MRKTQSRSNGGSEVESGADFSCQEGPVTSALQEGRKRPCAEVLDAEPDPVCLSGITDKSGSRRGH